MIPILVRKLNFDVICDERKTKSKIIDLVITGKRSTATVDVLSLNRFHIYLIDLDHTHPNVNCPLIFTSSSLFFKPYK